MNNNASPRRPPRRHGLAIGRMAMATAIIISGLAASVAAQAQATAGHVFGEAPAGDTVLAHSNTKGLQREGKVNAKGRYAISHLPVGVYTVTLEKDGTPVAKHLNVGVIAGSGSRVDFNCAEGKCAGPSGKL
ncbi:carboxypeptidase-like regulatory domain-containing protein [Rhodanobacter lindaniclasticus]